MFLPILVSEKKLQGTVKRHLEHYKRPLGIIKRLLVLSCSKYSNSAILDSSGKCRKMYSRCYDSVTRVRFSLLKFNQFGQYFFNSMNANM